MKKILSVLSLVAVLGLGVTNISFAEDLPAAAEATMEKVADTAPVAEAAPAEAAPAEAAAAPAPTANKGDTAWMLVATALVTLMTIPGLALFYGGLVRQKNMLSVL
ncbi:MAG TPA: ammonia channel protein, partial [Methylophilaceae bacterium]|nr:ammonia channel protein [Methylophilaceae bacterium]